MCLQCFSAFNCLPLRRTVASGPLGAGALVHGGSARCPRSLTVDRRRQVSMTCGSRAGHRVVALAGPRPSEGGRGGVVLRSTGPAELHCRSLVPSFDTCATNCSGHSLREWKDVERCTM